MRWFPWEKLSRYPHIGRRDKSLIDDFIDQNPAGFERVAYDIPVGEGVPIFTPEDPAYLRNWAYLTRLKIDAIGYNNSSYTLIEFKQIGDCSGIGQLLMYNLLLNRQVATPGNNQLMYVCRRFFPDVMNNCQQFGILPIFVPFS